MAAPLDFYGWKQDDLEDGLKAMGCQNASVGKLSPSVKTCLLRSEDSLGQPTEIECLKSIQSTKFKLFNDPIHGSIELHPLLAYIVNMRAFTRLKNIRQLGGVYYVYPGATHTRFEHSIGTCYIAGEYIRMLQRKQPELHITTTEALCVEIAALCHDLGHGPFSHLFEKDVIKKLKREYKIISEFPIHEKLSTMVFKHHIYLEKEELFHSYGIGDEEAEFIKELIDHELPSDVSTTKKRKQLQKPKRLFLYEIVANKHTGIDVDKWDYFARDCHYMGILTEFDWRRLMTLSRVNNVGDGVYRICYRDKEVNNIYGMFRTRSSLHQKAYQHKSVIASEHMIALAIDRVKDLPLVLPWNPSDKKKSDAAYDERVSVMNALEGVTESPPKLEGYLALNDSIVHLILHSQESDDSSLSEAKLLLQQLDERRKYAWIATESVTSMIVTEKEIEKECDEDLDYQSDDIYIRPVEISYASEKDENGKKDYDPVKFAHFYTKKKPWEAIKGDGEHMEKLKFELIYPKEFAISETRFYCKQDKYQKLSKAYKNAHDKKKKMVTERCEATPSQLTTKESPSQYPAKRKLYTGTDLKDDENPIKKSKSDNY